MLKTQLEDGSGDGTRQTVFSDGSAYISSKGIPPYGKPWPIQPFVAKLTTAAGATDMRVAGTLAVPITFSIVASTLADRYITAVSFFIADDNPTLAQFGAITALTNGCLFSYETKAFSTQIVPTLKSNFDFVRSALIFPAFSSGSSNDAFKSGTVLGTAEAYTPVIKFSDWLPPFGLKLSRGSLDSISFLVRDNTTAIDGFDAIAYGFDRFPDIFPPRAVSGG